MTGRNREYTKLYMPFLRPEAFLREGSVVGTDVIREFAASSWLVVRWPAPAIHILTLAVHFSTLSTAAHHPSMRSPAPAALRPGGLGLPGVRHGRYRTNQA